MNAARDHGVPVIEDACEAIGARYKQRVAGTMGDAGVFAFYPNKQMTSGEGGMVVTNRDDWAHVFRSLRNQGRDVFDSWLSHSRLGFNYRMDEMSAALGGVQAGRIEELLDKRARVAERYTKGLQETSGIVPPRVVDTTTRMSWFCYVIRLEDGLDRIGVMNALQEEGVPSRPYFSPIHLQPFYVERFGFSRGDFPVTERLGDSSLALPFSGVMTNDQIDYVIEKVAAAAASG
jgi:dTDP-4-amino-4,6-dideoxygalactose transaminase